MKYKLAIFDMDGTILDTLDDLAGCLNHALAQSGYPQRTKSEVRLFLGNGIARLVERGVPAGTDKQSEKKVFDDFNAYYKLHCADNTHPYDGIIPLLRKLSENGVKTAVCSNKADYAVGSLSEKYFGGLFDISAGAKDGVRKKPAPDAVLDIMKRLGISPSEAVYIGDSEVDIQTAQNAAIDCIIVDWGYRDRDFLEKSGAKAIASSSSELYRLLM